MQNTAAGDGSRAYFYPVTDVVTTRWLTLRRRAEVTYTLPSGSGAQRTLLTNGSLSFWICGCCFGCARILYSPIFASYSTRLAVRSTL